MSIKCGCGNTFFTKQVRLSKTALNVIEEKTYYICSKCGRGASEANLIYDVKHGIIDDTICSDYDF